MPTITSSPKMGSSASKAIPTSENHSVVVWAVVPMSDNNSMIVWVVVPTSDNNSMVVICIRSK